MLRSCSGQQTEQQSHRFTAWLYQYPLLSGLSCLISPTLLSLLVSKYVVTVCHRSIDLAQPLYCLGLPSQLINSLPAVTFCMISFEISSGQILLPTGVAYMVYYKSDL